MMINKNAVITIAKKEITSQSAGYYINVPNFGRPLTILNSSRVCTEKLYRLDV